MPKQSTPEVGDEQTTTAERKTVTNWRAFEKAALMPVEFKCQAYRPMQLADSSCHSRLQLNAKGLLPHMNVDTCSGGFRFRLRKGDKAWPGWRQFEDLGVEAQDFRCEICDAVVPFHPGHILKHMKPHRGKVSRPMPGGIFNITLSVGMPTLTEEEALAADWTD